ncbi:MAG: shikimate kinase I [Candidatus Muproteobacteria bacterium RBG_16_60_9]|uniref:Shikimate kinase n=1 Tax=Candidatus Muproteobacteria bacterium RBG_16_60_9 TaxID=1817755 RepID=A0A1F6VLJ4_9PROT|nr:MAG: shikimate kinase I [Candidatus Muproteobacteria bacterium RBG_16_60_9]
MGKVDRIFLIGPMGAGKSTIGRHLADALQKDFIDSDHEIERRTGASVSLIFEIEGEEGFRRREAAILDELTQLDNVVLATGGGAVLAASNRETLKSRGTVVYLQAPIATLVARTHRDRNRPLLRDGERHAKFEEIMQVRGPLYLEIADVVVTADQRPPATVTQEIVSKLKILVLHGNA